MLIIIAKINEIAMIDLEENMRKILFFIIAFFVLNTGEAFCKTLKYSVLPFKVIGPEEYRYLSQGIQSMIISRLNTPSKLEPVEIKEGIVDKNPLEISKKYGLNVLIWGDATVLGNNITIHINFLDNSGKAKTKIITSSQDTLISEFNREIKSLKNELLGIKEQPKVEVNKKSNPYTKQSQLNPSFEYIAPTSAEQRGYVRTQSLPYAMVGMDIGDGDGDGKNEVFIMSKHAVHAYNLTNNKLKLLSEYSFGRNKNALNINVFDYNRDGFAEIIISTVDNEGKPKGFIFSFKNKKFKIEKENINYFLSVKRIPPDYSKRLVGQGTGLGKIFDSRIHEVVTMRGELRLGPTLNLPQDANVFNFAYIPEKDSYKIVTVNDYGNIKVYNNSLNLIYKTTKSYAGSSVKIVTSNAMPGLGENVTDPKNMYYLPTRLVVKDLEKDGTFELIVAENLSVSSMYFSRYRDYPEGQIHALFWDGLGLNLKWKTKTIKGSIMDYGFGDIDNNSHDELYVGINTHPGPLGIKNKRTIVLFYRLNLKK